MNNKLRIAIIGAGMYTTGRGTDGYGTIIPALIEWERENQCIEVINIVGTNVDRLNQSMKKIKSIYKKTGINIKTFGYPTNDNKDADYYKNIINESKNLSCVIIAVPDHLHEKIAGDCLKKGIHTLVVKPLTLTLNGAKYLINLQKKYNAYGLTEFHKRYDRHNLKIKEAIQNDEIGSPLYFIVEYSQRKIIPTKLFSRWVDNTNVFQYLGVHYADLIYFLTNAKPVRLQTKGQYGWLKENGINTYDSIHVTIEWEMNNNKRFLSFIHTNWIDPNNTSAMSDQRIKVIGTKGRIESNQKNRGLQKVTDDQNLEEINPDFCNTYTNPNGEVIYKGYGIDSIKTFLDDIYKITTEKCDINFFENKRPTFSDSLVSTSIIEAVNKGLKAQNSWIDI